MFVTSAALLALLAATGVADAKPAPANLFANPNDMRLRHARLQPPAVFAKQAPTPALPDEQLSLRIHLKKGDRAGLEAKLLEVSTPGHPNYGKHLSKAELETYVRPTEATTATVKAWLDAHNLTANAISPAGDILEVALPVSSADSLLSAQYSRFTHSGNGLTALRTLSYSLPAALDDHVLVMEPTTDFVVQPKFTDPLKFSAHTAANLTSFINNFVGGGHIAKVLGLKEKRLEDFCNQWMTPQCLSELYGFPLSNSTGTGRATLAVTGFIEQYANEADLQTFLATLRPDMPADSKFTLQTLDGGKNDQDLSKAGTEASLDVQYSVGIAGHVVPVTFISVGDDGPNNNGFLDIVNNLLAQDELPQVLATSYGMDESAVGTDLAQQLCDAYMQLGSRGVSVIFSSGDGGVGAGDCTEFTPTFPSGCPYVTSVGATDGFSPEKVASFSSGGFSNVFDAPDWQKDHISGYLKQLGSTYSGLYNSTGRAFPDIAASGTNFPTVISAAWQPLGGTSASTPAFASIIALLNDELLSVGRNPLGFLNPWIYAQSSAFTDITEGNNPGCGTDGFDAKSGWDPATGLGTPVYSALRKAAGLK